MKSELIIDEAPVGHDTWRVSAAAFSVNAKWYCWREVYCKTSEVSMVKNRMLEAYFR